MNKKTVKYPNLIYQMILKDISNKELAEKLNIHLNTLKNKVDGKTEFTYKESITLGEVLGKDPKYLLSDK